MFKLKSADNLIVIKNIEFFNFLSYFFLDKKVSKKSRTANASARSCKT
jgi:hypothetical protein